LLRSSEAYAGTIKYLSDLVTFKVLRSTMNITMLVSGGSIAPPSQTSEPLSRTSSEQDNFPRSLDEHLLNSGPASMYLPTPAHTYQTSKEYWESHVHDQRMVQQIYPQACEGQSTSNDIISKPFPCSTCRKGFARRSDLARHGETK
jgi:hypothetical protein